MKHIKRGLTKSALTNKLDKECSRIIRSQGICVSCKMTDYSKLQCCHIFSRTYRNTRWSLDNLLCMCAGCHFESHKNPIKFVEKVKEHLGEYKYEMLKSQHNVIKRWTVLEMSDLLESLRKI